MLSSAQIKAALTFVFALATLPFAAAAAQATTVTEYAVTVEGQAAYARTEVYPPSPLGSEVEQVHAEFQWKAEWPKVTFFDKLITHTSQPSMAVSGIDADMHVTIPTPDGPAHGDCTGTALAEPAGPAWLGEGVLPTPDPNMESIDIRTFPGAVFQLANCSGVFGSIPQQLRLGGGGEPIPLGAFDQPFELPHEAIGMGKIIQLLEAHPSGDECPENDVFTTNCTLDWTATVTFDRTGQWQIGDPPPPPSDGGTPDPDEVEIPMPRGTPDPDEIEIPNPGKSDSDLDDIEIPTPGKKAKLTPGSRSAELTLTCPVACRGTATAYLAGRGSAAARSRPPVRARSAPASTGHPLGRTQFRGRAGQPAKVVIRFGAAARRAIRRAGKVRIGLEIAPASGGKSVQRSVLLRSPAA